MFPLQEYHSPLKQELLKGSGGVVAADIEESLDDDEEEGALFGATSPDPHRLTATPLLRETGMDAVALEGSEAVT